MAKATTKGGDAKKLAFVAGWILPSKFLFPLNTDATAKSLALIA